MCGIVGLFRSQSSQPTAPTVTRMSAALRHRGPDDAGVAGFERGTLGMRRLAIFDPAHGYQPMVSPEGRLTLVFNGAIYNYRELRTDLSTSWKFVTQCDTEVLLAAYARWGEKCLPRLRGMFAFAVWDDTERKLFVARDPFGIKPFYFHTRDGNFTFASEVRALLAGGEISPTVDRFGVRQILAWGAVPQPRTIFAGVESLPPASYGIWRGGQFTQEKYWHLPAAARAPSQWSETGFIRDLRTQLEEVTKVHLVADAPVGAFLSGGLDSAAICALAQRTRSVPLATFSIGFDEPLYSESGYAESTAAFLGTAHRTLTLTGKAVAADFEKILQAFDQPTGDGVNTYYVSELAHRGGVKVALSGLGGDELFGGYPSFTDIPRRVRALKFWQRLPRSLRARAVQHLRRGDTRKRKLADLLEHGRDANRTLGLNRRFFSSAEVCGLLTPADTRPDEEDIFHPAQAWLDAFDSRSMPMARVSAWEIATYMTDILLTDSDVMSMAHSLELRVPFVDRPLVEWLAQQPDHFRSARPAKRLLYAAVADLLPPDLVGRKKRGFTFPFAQWMRTDLRPPLEEIFATESVDRSGLFQSDSVRKCWLTYQAGTDNRDWSRVWTLAMLIAFVNRRGTAALESK